MISILNKLLTYFAIIGIVFIAGHDFAKKEACEGKGKVWEYDLGECR